MAFLTKEFLQTCTVTILSITFISGPLIGWSLYIYLFFTSFWWLSLLYTVWLYHDRDSPKTGSHRKFSWQNCKFWKYSHNYFPTKLTTTHNFKMDSKKNYLFCCFPHGVIPLGPFHILTRQFYQLYPNFKMYLAILHLLCLTPFVRDVQLALGMISCRSESLDYILGKAEGGCVVSLFPGGAAEVMHSKPNKYKFEIKKRKGFVKIALKNGAPLVPVIVFGQNDLYQQVENRIIKCVLEYVKKYCGFAPVLFYGRGCIPFKKPLTAVCMYSYKKITPMKADFLKVGTPIEVAKTGNPTSQQIDELHDLFVLQLTELFNEYKYKYLENPESKILEFE